MLNRYWVAIIVLVLASLAVVLYTTSDGDSDADMRYRGCVEERCFFLCLIKSPWEKLRCQNDCRGYCKEKELPRNGTVRYYGKWPFRRAINDGKQAFASVVCSVLIFAMHLRGWSRLWYFLYHRMPLDEDNKPFYDYAWLWNMYGLLSLNSWLWRAAFHFQDIDLTEKLNYSSTLALFGCSFVVAIMRSFNVRSKDVKTTADSFALAAPPIAFVTTHILMYLNTYKLDYGWNMKVCLVLVVAELTIWAVWAGVTQQYLRWKIWLVVAGGGVAMLLEIYDLLPYRGLFDAHFLRYASTIPLTCIWWQFIQDDAESLTIVDLTRRMNYEEIVNSLVIKKARLKKKGKHGKKRK